MKILHLSDTHGSHRRLVYLPEADVLVHSGDFTMVGTEQEALDFLEWLCDLPYRHKLFICGNHDNCLYDCNIEGLDSNVHYLRNSGIEIEGVKFYGIPLFVLDDVAARQKRYYDNIPSDTDVLITHCPAYGILDYDDGIGGKWYNYGSEDLLAKLSSLNLRAHLFGHIHRQHDVVEQGDVIYSNGSIMNEDYTKLYTPNLIKI